MYSGITEYATPKTTLNQGDTRETQEKRRYDAYRNGYSGIC